MAGRLKDRVAIVNGGGSSGPGWGNGKCTAITFAREGAKVVVVDINPAAAEETAGLIRSEGGIAMVIQADVTSQADNEALVAKTLSEFGRLDILAQIVGISGKLSFLDDVGGKDWDQVMNVNLKATFLAAQAAIKSTDEAARAVVRKAKIEAMMAKFLLQAQASAQKDAVKAQKVAAAAARGGQQV